MAFRNLHRKMHRGKKYLKSFAKANPNINKFSAFRTGFNTGYVDAIKWVMKKLKCKNITELKEKLNKNEN